MPGARCSAKTALLLLALGTTARAGADPPRDPGAAPPPPPGATQPPAAPVASPTPSTSPPAAPATPAPAAPAPAPVATAKPAAPSAQPPAPQRFPAPYPIAWPPPVDLVSTEPGVSLSVFAAKAHPDRDAPLLTCGAPPCRVPLWPGRYKIHVTESSATVAGARVFETRGPAVVTVDPDTTEHRDLGLVMGIAGPIVTLVGVGLALSCGPECNRSTAERSRVGTGVFLVLGGLTITPVGWVMFGTSFKPEVEVRENR